MLANPVGVSPINWQDFLPELIFGAIGSEAAVAIAPIACASVSAAVAGTFPPLAPAVFWGCDFLVTGAGALAGSSLAQAASDHEFKSGTALTSFLLGGFSSGGAALLSRGIKHAHAAKAALPMNARYELSEAAMTLKYETRVVNAQGVEKWVPVGELPVTLEIASPGRVTEFVHISQRQVSVARLPVPHGVATTTRALGAGATAAVAAGINSCRQEEPRDAQVVGFTAPEDALSVEEEAGDLWDEYGVPASVDLNPLIDQSTALPEPW